MTGRASHPALHLAPVGSLVRQGDRRLAEGEDVGPDARVEEADLEGAVDAGVGLADELVEPWLVHRAGARSSTSPPCAAPGAAPSRRTSKRTAAPEAGGVRTRLRSRAPKRYVIDPPSASSTADSSSTAHRAGQRPLVQPQPAGAVAGPALAAGGADVRLRGAQAVPVGRELDARLLRVDPVAVDAEQAADDRLGLLVGALAEVVVADAPLAVEDVERRPVAVLERASRSRKRCRGRPGTRRPWRRARAARPRSPARTRTPASGRRRRRGPGRGRRPPTRGRRAASGSS